MTDVIHMQVPSHYFHHKNNRIRKKWRKKYAKIVSVYRNVYPIGIKSDSPIQSSNSFTLSFKGKYIPTSELESKTKELIAKYEQKIK